MLEVAGLGKKFGGLQAVADLSFSIPAGSLTAIIGPNGAGKTTLLNLITGYARPTTGLIRFEDQDISRMAPYRVCRRGIGRTFQIVQPFTELTVRDNVAAGFLFAGKTRTSVAHARELAEEVVAEVGRQDKASIQAGNLSIGDKKKLELARALATRPKLLLLDEVMGGLSHRDIDDLVGLLRRIQARGVTLVMIEHVLRAVMALAERIIVVNFGRLVFDGLPTEALSHPEVIASYLGSAVAA